MILLVTSSGVPKVLSWRQHTVRGELHFTNGRRGQHGRFQSLTRSHDLVVRTRKAIGGMYRPVLCRFSKPVPIMGATINSHCVHRSDRFLGTLAFVFRMKHPACIIRCLCLFNHRMNGKENYRFTFFG
jgi:hypothetical protein